MMPVRNKRGLPLQDPARERNDGVGDRNSQGNHRDAQRRRGCTLLASQDGYIRE